METPHIRMSKKQTNKQIKLDSTKCLRECAVTGTLLHCWLECRISQPLWKTVWLFPIKLNIHLSNDLALQEKKIYVLTITCVWMFIAALIIMSKNWKPPKSLSTIECVNRLWYIHWKEYYSAIKMKELLVAVTTCMNCKYYIIPSGKKKPA